MNRLRMGLLALGLAAPGCFQDLTHPDATSGLRTDAAAEGGDGVVNVTSPAAVDNIDYRDELTKHAGCTTDGLNYPAANILGYTCAAKSYDFPAGVTENTAKPIVLLIHGNSDAPDSWERFPAGTGKPMVAESLVAAGYRTFAVDLRIAKVDDPQGNNDTENAARNIDHGWSVPIAQHLIESVLGAYPGRKIALIGFSLGVTIIRDALRRATFAGRVNPWARVADVILLAGANHGVSTFAKLCGKNPTMRGRVACELGPRDNYSPTDFLKLLNGSSGAWETPCADGQNAFGVTGLCGGNTVRWTTIVMKDIADGSYQDEFVSQASSKLAGADNRNINLGDVDESGYFFNGLLKNHYGAARSQAALTIMLEKLGQ